MIAVARVAGCNDDDLRLLAAKGFVIPFDSGVIVITDWNINNTLKNDRYRETVYQEEKSKICTLPSGKYALGSDVDPECIQDGSIMEPQHNVTKPNVTKPNKEGAGKPPTPARKKFTPPSLDEVQQYCVERNNGIDAQHFLDYYQARGWKYNGGQTLKDWRAAIRTWERNSKPQQNDRNRIRSANEYEGGDFFDGGGD